MISVALCHAQADNEQALALSDALERHGVAVRRVIDDVHHSRVIQERMNKAMKDALLVVAWCSRSFAAARACQWMLTVTWLIGLEEGSPQRRLLIINPEDNDDHILPETLRRASRGDNLPAHDLENCAAKIAERLKETAAGLFGLGDQAPPSHLANAIPKTTDKPTLQEALGVALHPGNSPLVEVKRHISSLSDRLAQLAALGEAKKMFLGGQYPWQLLETPRFAGHQEHLWTLHAMLADMPCVGIVNENGMSGLGCAALAEEYGLRFAAAYPGGILRLSAAFDRDSQLLTLARSLRLAPYAPAGRRRLNDLSPIELEQLLGNHLSGARSYLWVVSDLPADLSATELEPWQAPTANGRTIFVSNGRPMPAALPVVTLAPLSTANALALITSRLPPKTEEDAIFAQNILDGLGGHAMALDLAGTAILRRGYEETAADISHRSDRTRELAERISGEVPANHAQPIAALMLSVLQRLKADEWLLLSILSLFPEIPVPERFVEEVWTMVPENGSPLPASERAEDVIFRAERQGMVKQLSGNLRVHRLLREAVLIHSIPLDLIREGMVDIIPPNVRRFRQWGCKDDVAIWRRLGLTVGLPDKYFE